MVAGRRRRKQREDDHAHLLAEPELVLTVPADRVDAVAEALRADASQRPAEVRSVLVESPGVRLVLGHEHPRHVALARRLSTLRRAGLTITGFRWRDALEDADDRWLDDTIDLWDRGRHNDGRALEPMEVARRRIGRLTSEALVERLARTAAAPDVLQRRRWTLAYAAAQAALNTHTTAAGDLLVAAAAAVADVDGFTAMKLLDGAREVVGLSHVGIDTAIAEAPLVPLVDHGDWHVHDAATQLLAALPPPRSAAATQVLCRVAGDLAAAGPSTETRAEYVVGALAACDPAISEVDGALDALRNHVSSAVRVDATWTLAARRGGEVARPLWEPWLASRSFNERTTAESMIARWGDERDVPEVVRIVERRAKPPKGRTYWPPLAAEGIDFLVRHRDVPEAASMLDRLRDRWDRHDDDVRRWITEHHPDLAP